MTRILVIDDDRAIRQLILDTLTFESYEVLGAENGLVGIQLARIHHPDLIICDVTMPEVNGYGVLLNLHSDPATSTIPFIFLTARSSKAEIREGMELGADDYLSKPFDSAELLAAVKSRLARHLEITTEYEKKIIEFRGSLLHMLPHEFRTPLTTILGSSKVILSIAKDIETEQLIDLVERIHTSGLRLHHLIDNFLLLAQLELLKQDSVESQRMRQHSVVQPKASIEQYATAVAQRFHREADLTLDINDIEMLPIMPDSLKKIVEELVDNAFKFSKIGTPVRVDGNMSGSWYVLRVSDKGRGMLPTQIANVGVYTQFQRQIFEQQGSGLGLILAKKLTELHGGELRISSIPDKRTAVEVAFVVT